MENASEYSVRETFEKVLAGLPPRIPVSTYRLQFNKTFTFRDARAIVPYLEELGITDIYASPYFKAQRGSLHGYDVVDPGRLNPEIGSEADYEAFVSELERRGMGHILDIVPNHMSIAGGENAWWMDVLENGPSSPFAAYFDIDWRPVVAELENKVIIPVLGDHYGAVLENQEIRLGYESGAFFIQYYEHRFPVGPSTYPDILTHRLDELERTLGSEDPNFQELLSIVTALRHLPLPSDNRAESITERRREKEISKRRLEALYELCPPFKAFLDRNVEIFNGSKDNRKSFDLLDQLLSSQVYRLSFWRVATEEINYRRFFDVNDLAAVRTEDPEVFGGTHSLVFKLIREGKVSGLRTDHPDGLHNPKEYFGRLQRECFVQLCMRHLGDDPGAEEKIRSLYEERVKDDPSLGRPFYIVGEKILMSGERLPEGWPIYGTTGYSFMNAAAGILLDGDSEKAVEAAFARFCGRKLVYPDLVYKKKKLIMQTSMASEINVLGHALDLIAETHRDYRDFTLNSLTDAIVEVIAAFPVYRTYIDAAGSTDRDLRYIWMAVSKAKRRRRDLGTSIFDFLRDVLTVQCPEKLDEGQKLQWLEFAMKFQQLTGPVMAKGLEDTVFYVYDRMVSLNEVGGDPSRFGITPEAFHGQNIETIKHWPYALTATSTHDSKRSEDVRARINVISELPDEWRDCLRRWGKMNKRLKGTASGEPAPGRTEEYLLYQTLLGAWPMRPMNDEERSSFTERVKQYMEKAVREAKENSNWLNPDVEYEAALMGFVEGIINSGQFREDFERFQRKVSHFGMFNSLSQTLLKITSPGVPDFYQGTALWNLRLVDPDNRAPVDYALMMRTLKELKERERQAGALQLASELLGGMADGRVKMYATYKALNFRKDNRALYLEGSYVPLEAGGSKGASVLAFARAHGGAFVVTAVPRLITRITGDEPGMPLGDAWGDTHIILPEEAAYGTFREIFTDQRIGVIECEGSPALGMKEVFSDFPLALLERA